LAHIELLAGPRDVAVLQQRPPHDKQVQGTKIRQPEYIPAPQVQTHE
jgi:hypothetical protein